MKRFLLLASSALLLLAIAPSIATAQNNIYQVKKSLVSNVQFHTTNYGIFGLNVFDSQPDFTVPRGSNKTYFFGSGLWVGAKKPVSTDGGITFENKKLSFITYNPNSGRSWAYPGTYRDATPATIVQPILYHSEEFNRTTGEELNPATSAKWPLWLAPGEETSPLYPGTPFLYSIPSPNDRPAFMNGVDEQFFSYYHDNSLGDYELGFQQAKDLGFPIGLQITQNVYAWKPGDLRENVVVIQYEVENVSNETLRDCYLSQVLDPDIGFAGNDRVSFYDANPLLHAGIIWSEDEGVDYGTLAMIMLEAPVVDANGFVDPNRRSLFRSSTDVNSFINWSIDEDPATPEERYDYIASKRLDLDNGPGDKRVLMGTKPFNMAPGDKAHFAIAFAVLEGVTPNSALEKKGSEAQTDAIPELEALATTLNREYYETSFQTSSVKDWEVSTLAAHIWPNPAKEEAVLRMNLTERSDLSIQIVDNLGRTLRTQQQGNVEAGEKTFRLDLAGLHNGSYLVVLEAGTERQTLRFNVVQ